MSDDVLTEHFSASAPQPPDPVVAVPNEVALPIEGMTCAFCVARVERALHKVPGVAKVAVNLGTERARVTGLGLEVPALIAAVERAGYEARPVEDKADDGEAARDEDARRDLVRVGIAALLTAPLFIARLLHLAGLREPVPGWAQLAFATPVQFWLGFRFYRAGWRAIRAGAGNMDLLVALGTSAAYGLSLYLLVKSWIMGGMPALYFDSSTIIITLILFGKWLETRAKRQTGAAVPNRYAA